MTNIVWSDIIYNNQVNFLDFGTAKTKEEFDGGQVCDVTYRSAV